MTRPFLHPSTRRPVTRSAYRAITTEALIAECHALEASYAAVKVHEPEIDRDRVADYESVLNTVTEVLARRVEDGDPVAVDWYTSYDDDDTDAPSRLWADGPQADAAAQSPEDALENWYAMAALLSWLRASYCTGRRISRWSRTGRLAPRASAWRPACGWALPRVRFWPLRRLISETGRSRAPTSTRRRGDWHRERCRASPLRLAVLAPPGGDLIWIKIVLPATRDTIHT